MLTASVKWLCEHVIAVRVHPEGSYGDRWEWFCAASVEPGPKGLHAELAGALTAPSPSQARTVVRALWAEGFTSFGYERRNNRLARRVVVQRDSDTGRLSTHVCPLFPAPKGTFL